MHYSRTILFAALVACTSPVVAEPPRTAVVSVSDNDFDNAASTAALERRIADAADAVCGSNAMVENTPWRDILVCRANIRRDVYSAISLSQRKQVVRLGAR